MFPLSHSNIDVTVIAHTCEKLVDLKKQTRISVLFPPHMNPINQFFGKAIFHDGPLFAQLGVISKVGTYSATSVFFIDSGLIDPIKDATVYREQHEDHT